jgi:hypothetical protein
MPIPVIVAVSSDGTNRVCRSVDGGATWLDVAAASVQPWRGIAFTPSLGSGQGRFVAVASSTGGTDGAMYSDDGGATWTTAHFPETFYANGLVWSPS